MAGCHRISSDRQGWHFCSNLSGAAVCQGVNQINEMVATHIAAQPAVRQRFNLVALEDVVPRQLRDLGSTHRHFREGPAAHHGFRLL